MAIALATLQHRNRTEEARTSTCRWPPRSRWTSAPQWCCRKSTPMANPVAL